MNAAGRTEPAAVRLRRRHTRQRVADAIARGSVSGMIVGSVVFLLLPLALTLSMSFDARDYLGAFPPPALSLRWYAKFFSDPYLLKGLRTSLQLAALAALFATSVGLAAAVALQRLPTRTAQFLMALFLSPLIVPGVVIGFALLIFYARAGLENTFMRLLGGHVLITFPYAIRTVLAALGGYPPVADRSRAVAWREPHPGLLDGDLSARPDGHRRRRDLRLRVLARRRRGEPVSVRSAIAIRCPLRWSACCMQTST